MKNITIYSSLLFMLLVFIRCSEEEIAPVIEPENPLIDSISISGDPTQSFSMDGKKSNVTNDGYQIDGNLYAETDSGKVTIFENASFSVSQDLNGDLQSMQGSGPFNMPDFGFFKKFNFDEAIETAFVYNTGRHFKDNNDNFKSLPLRDTSYYFFFNILNLANGEDETLSVKNAELGLTSYFLNLDQQEIIIPAGKFEIKTGEGSISVGKDLAIGISVKKSFPFTPRQYPDSALNAVIDAQKAFTDMQGFLYLAGEMDLGSKIVPLKLDGQAVLDVNIDVAFSQGFSSSSMSFAMNGNLVFGHDLLDLLPMDFDAELTNTTVRFDYTANGLERNAVLKFAGEFDDNLWMETMLDALAGTNVSQYVPFTGNEGNMFMSLGDAWEFYVNTYFAINTPHLGKQPTREGTLHITEDQLFIRGALAIPFIPGELSASGRFGYNGDVHLEAKADKLTIEEIQLDANIDFDIYKTHGTLEGNVTFPFELGTIDIDGFVDKEGLKFTGSAGNKPVKFGQVSLPVSNLQLDANIRKSNPYLKFDGSLTLQQLQQPIVSVSGTFDSRGLEFIGSLNDNNLQLQQYASAMNIPFIYGTVTARSWEGIYVNGGVTLPFGLASATVDGYYTGRSDASGIPELFLDVNFNSDPTFTVKGVSLPSANLDLNISTMSGIKFNGSIDYGFNIGSLKAEGNITSNHIIIKARDSKRLNFGSYFFNSDVRIDFDTRSNEIGKIRAVVQTTQGNFSLAGNMNTTNIMLAGSLQAGCVNSPIPGFDVLRINKDFLFMNTKGFSSIFGISAKVIGAKDCNTEGTTISGISSSISLETGHFAVCIPVPGLPDACFSL